MNHEKKDLSRQKPSSPPTAAQKDDSIFLAIAETLPLAIYLSVGTEQVCEYINPKFIELFGYSLEEIPSAAEWWPQAYPDENYRKQVGAEWNEKIQRAIETQSSIEPMETVVTCKDGSTKFIRWGFITIGEKNYAYGQDLTEQKRSEKVLQESERRFHTLFEKAPLGYQSLDNEGHLLEANQAWLEMLGYHRDEVIGKWVGDFLPPDYATAFKERFPLFKAEGKTHSEFHMRHKDGTLRIIEVNGRIGYNPDGSFKQTHCILSDITERKQAEEALLAQEAKFKSTINDLLVGVVVHAADTSITLSNPQARNILGLSEEQMAGKKAIDPAWHFIHEDLSRLKVEEYPVSQVLSTGERISNLTLGIKEPDRKEITWVLLSAVPIFTNENKIDRVIVNFLDITKHKQAEEEEVRLKEQLDQAKKLEMIGQLAGGVAHDFNNILQTILGYTELAAGRIDPSAPVQSDLQEIQKAAKHASELTRQLLTFARKKESTAQVLDLNHSVQNTLKMLRPLFNKNIELSWVPGSNLWPVIIDHTQIDQILVNLVVNARDAISGANGEIKIIAENICINAPQSAYGNTISPGDYVKLSVSDTGCGMLIETQEKLFEPFFTTKEVDQGTGLGLSTVYGIVQENKGYIDVQSTPEHGTTFHVYLPRGNVAVPVSDPLEKCIATFQESETILLVEDDQSILRMCIRVLNDLGYTVLEAASSTAALQLAEEHANKIDLLITDIIMPGMNGYELANELKQRFPHLKLLFTSGYADNILNPSAGSLEQQAPLLPKPFTREQLASKIREVLDSDSIDQ